MSNSKDTEIKQTINELKKRLRIAELIMDKQPMTENLKELRHMLFYVHTEIERALEFLISNEVLRWEQRLPDPVNMALDMTRMDAIFYKMEFHQKLDACKKLDLLTRKTYSLFYKINEWRIFFAHPATYRKKIDNLEEDQSSYHDLLKKLNRSIDIVIKLYLPQEKVRKIQIKRGLKGLGIKKE